MPLVNRVFDPEPAESVSLTQFPDAVNGLGNRMPFDLLDGSPRFPRRTDQAPGREPAPQQQVGLRFRVAIESGSSPLPAFFRKYDLPGIRLYGPTAFILLAQNSYGVDAQPSGVRHKSRDLRKSKEKQLSPSVLVTSDNVARVPAARPRRSPATRLKNRGNSRRPEGNRPKEQIEDVAASFYVGHSTLSTERWLSGACWSI